MTNNINYIRIGDYYVPNILVPQKSYSIGKYGRLHKRFLKENYPGIYSSMLMKCTLLEYISEVDKTAENEVERLIKQIAAEQGITEEVKATNQMKWVGLMCNIKSQAEEIVFSEMIYTLSV